MSSDTNSQTQARTWLTPDQVEKLRNACYSDDISNYLQDRNDAIVTLLYDTGLRVGELVELDEDDLNLDNSELYLAPGIQKDYPVEGRSPSGAYLDLEGDTVRTLRSYLNNRWKDPEALFPSRESNRMSTESVRNVLKQVAKIADVRPYRVDGGKGGPGDVSPHTLRHSVAYRMLREEGHRLIDVRDRLRHTSIATTERVYEHFKKR